VLFEAYRLRWAAKQYATRRPSELARRYGASAHYTADQIRRTAEQAGLNLRFVVLGYAAFLAEREFSDASEHLSVNPRYAGARALFDRFRPRHWDSADSKETINSGGSPGPDDV
jgi:hypothetical protein